jgi:ATP-dependent DNA helicase DinG
MTWTELEANLAESLPNYEPRPQQQLLATEIEAALGAGEVIIGQGGCGVGKSFALLIPMIEHSLRTKQPVGISTATKSLQSQYIRTDVPFLKKNLDIDFEAVVLKGRGNYACQAKLRELQPGDVRNAGAILTELAEEGHSGDLDDLVAEFDPRDRPKLVSTSDECPGKNDCPFSENCFAEAAKTKAKTANLVIVNHAVLIADLKIKREGGFGVLPGLSGVGIDESHELENYTTNALGSEFTQRGIQNLASEATNVMSQAAQSETGALILATQNLFEHLGALLGRERTVPFGDREVLEAEDLLGPLLRAIISLKKTAEAFRIEGNDAVKLKRLKKKINSLNSRVQEVIFSSSADLVRWVEKDEKRGVVLKYAPLDVGPFLKEMIWDQMPAALVSATVAIGDDFSFVAEQHGIERYRSVDAGSPFDFEKQATLLIPANCDPTDANSWRMSLQITIREAIAAAGGRALLLFSSRSSMQTMHSMLKDYLTDQLGLHVMIQGEGTNRQLAETFKSDETSVLFGLKSFATGFDVQGDALRLVIIDKMPFPVPSDVIFKARSEAIDAKKTGWNDGSFMKLSVPMMALDLLQGVGRLIRTTQDEGTIIIGDSRLLTKGYGKKILRALPPARRVGTLAEATEYLEDLSSRRG